MRTLNLRPATTGQGHWRRDATGELAAGALPHHVTRGALAACHDELRAGAQWVGVAVDPDQGRIIVTRGVAPYRELDDFLAETYRDEPRPEAERRARSAAEGMWKPALFVAYGGQREMMLYPIDAKRPATTMLYHQAAGELDPVARQITRL